MKTKLHALLFLTLSLAAAPFARATAGDFTIFFGAGILTNSNSTPLVDGSLVILLTNGLNSSFTAPTSSAFVTGDDVLLDKFGTNSVDFGGPGGLIATLNPSFSSALTVGQQIMVRWFPSLTLASSTPGAGTSYGEYSFTAGNTDSTAADWLIPGSGSIGPTLATTAIFGSLNPSFGQASLLVAGATPIPEPSAFALLGGLAALGLAGWRRRSRAAA